MATKKHTHTHIHISGVDMMWIGWWSSKEDATFCHKYKTRQIDLLV